MRSEFSQNNKIDWLDAMKMRSSAYWTPNSFEELARLQAVTPLPDVDVLTGGFLKDEDIEEFLDDIYEHR